MRKARGLVMMKKEQEERDKELGVAAWRVLSHERGKDTGREKQTGV